ncbi:uncharacterized protein LOC124417803 [Gallus gallus]|uniref:uncharacterized protein LOC124417803 n=1 Tax=Gallus gallus TaxID=9031 RepID=UPI001EFFCA63|nr:uncharacterized protein LOC124417803 [Gallus gallus]
MLGPPLRPPPLHAPAPRWQQPARAVRPRLAHTDGRTDGWTDTRPGSRAPTTPADAAPADRIGRHGGSASACGVARNLRRRCELQDGGVEAGGAAQSSGCRQRLVCCLQPPRRRIS